MVIFRSICLSILFLCLVFSLAERNCHADLSNLDNTGAVSESEPADLEQLLLEAQELFIANRPIDARSKLLKALQIAPNDYRPHMMLGAYYLSEVGHFPLAYRYLKTAELHFEKQFGSDRDNTLQHDAWRQHARLLYLISEAELNLDRYQDSLNTLDRFGAKYWDDWYPGARAWVLMKLRRVDEAITVAQAGLLRGADIGRTYNILGILLSLKGNRELSIEAFARAIKGELALGGSAQVATPLNNAGEVYRELFKDSSAEAAWLKALQLPDGCEHILPSLNLATLYIDELRLFQAERVLQDFQACFANRSTREDSEHRALLALMKGKIALREGKIDEALSELNLARERQQWFGKIGTTEGDVKIAAAVSMAQALAAKADTLKDKAADHWWSSLWLKAQIPVLRVRAWWLNRNARDIAIDELNDFEDLYIRSTDTMLEYPTLGSVLAGFPTRTLKSRILRLKSTDSRIEANSYYQLYQGINLVSRGKMGQALTLLGNALSSFRAFDRLARSEALANSIIAEDWDKSFLGSLLFWQPARKETDLKRIREIEELFSLLASQVRYYNLTLPVAAQVSASTRDSEELAESVASSLDVRFFRLPETLAAESRFILQISAEQSKDSPTIELSLALTERGSGYLIARTTASVNRSDEVYAGAINDFIDKVFSHKVDPPGEPVPKLEMLDGIM